MEMQKEKTVSFDASANLQPKPGKGLITKQSITDQINNYVVKRKETNEYNLTHPKKNVINKEARILKRNGVEFQLFLFTLCILFFIVFMYVIRPLAIIVSIYFLVNIATLDETSNETGTPIRGDAWEMPYPLIGFGVLFVLPLLHFIYPGREIVDMQVSYGKKIVATLVIILELVLEIPFPYLYDNNMYSVFLYDEIGVEKLLAPWLVFYPTRFISSFLESFRNLSSNTYFIAMGIYSYNRIKGNYYNESERNIVVLMITLNIFCFVYYFIIIVLRLVKECRICAQQSLKRQKEEDEKKNKTYRDGENNTVGSKENSKDKIEKEDSEKNEEENEAEAEAEAENNKL